MIYVSTRDNNIRLSSKEAILRGLSDDGGLYVSPEMHDARMDMEPLMHMSYEDTVYEVFKRLLTDFTDSELRDSISKAYEGKFETPEITPLTRLGDYYLLELYHGPTAAFKDVALCMLPQLMSRALGGRRLMILTATSGDTGKAALEGFKDAEGIGITVFYPDKGVSDIQYLQMATQEGDNTFVAAVKGNFDDCQTSVKRLFSSLKEEAAKRGVGLTSANSINIGRLVPQIIYYIDAYRSIYLSGVISYGDKVDFVVPTGNFGDILAGYYALVMGLPVGRLIVASNANKVLTDFFETGVYDTGRAFIKTISPSMDILVSSNLERMLYYASGCDAGYVTSLMRELSEHGRFSVSGDVLNYLKGIYDCGYATDEEAKRYIRKAFEEEGRLIDPHTAVGYKVAEDTAGDRPTVILSTASPFKFAEDVYKSLFGELDHAEGGFRYMDELGQRTGETAPRALKELRNKPVLHDRVLGTDEMGDFVLSKL